MENKENENNLIWRYPIVCKARHTVSKLKNHIFYCVIILFEDLPAQNNMITYHAPWLNTQDAVAGHKNAKHTVNEMPKITTI